MWLQEYNYEYYILSRKQTVQRNEKELLGVGKREGNGRKCLWLLHDSRKGVQTHFADLVNNACRVDARPARNGSEPAAGFLFPLSQVQGSRPFSPPLPPHSGLPGSRREPARPRPVQTKPLGSEPGPRLLPAPFPAPSSRSSFSFLQVT